MILTARSTYYADKIHEQAGNPRALFHTVGSLLHTNHKPALPDHDHLEQLLNSFSNHFKDKIAIIRCDFDSHATQPTLCSSEAIATSQLSTFQQADDTQLYISFSPLSNEDTHSAMMRLQACVVAIQNWMIVNKLKTKR